ncbi:MAG: cyclic-phosphate processing receiver domain-containing protein [Chlorobiaceae bacterium]
MTELFLDDDLLRHEVFAEQCKTRGNEPFHAHTIDEFMGLTDGKHFDIVHLDHDLNDFSFISKFTDMYGTGEQNGVDAARWLAVQLPEHRPSKVVIHSWNPSGAARMRAILEEAGFNDIVVEEFDQVTYFERLLKWKQEGRHHAFLQHVAPEEKLHLLGWKDVC